MLAYHHRGSAIDGNKQFTIQSCSPNTTTENYLCSILVKHFSRGGDYLLGSRRQFFSVWNTRDVNCLARIELPISSTNVIAGDTVRTALFKTNGLCRVLFGFLIASECSKEKRMVLEVQYNALNRSFIPLDDEVDDLLVDGELYLVTLSGSGLDVDVDLLDLRGDHFARL